MILIVPKPNVCNFIIDLIFYLLIRLFAWVLFFCFSYSLSNCFNFLSRCLFLTHTSVTTVSGLQIASLFFPYRNDNLLFPTVLEICPDWLMKKLANACLSNFTLFLSSDAVWKMSMSEKIWEGTLKCRYNIFVWSFIT